MKPNSKQKITYTIPMSSPDLTEAEREAVAAVLRTPNLSMGSEYLAFEEAVAKYTGARHAITVNSGTAGLHLCVRAAEINIGDIVITTPFSFVASSNVILFENAVPIFVDVDNEAGNMDTEQLSEAVRDLVEKRSAAGKWLPRKGGSLDGEVKAILPVDVFGQPSDLDPIVEIADLYGLKVIEDSCEAIGAEYKGKQLGQLSDFAVFAFYPNKQITTGEGGMIVTDDDEAAKMMRALRNQGRSAGDTWLDHTYLGYNYRMDEMSAALGQTQMSRLDELLEKRALVAEWYTERLAEIVEIEVPNIVESTSRMSWFIYVIRLDESIDRNDVIEKLGVAGIPARPYFSPIHMQPYMVERFGYQEGDYPVTEDLGRRGLAIPFSSVMTEEQVEQVCQALVKILRE